MRHVRGAAAGRSSRPAIGRSRECIADTVIFPTCNTAVAGVASHNNATFGPPNGELNSNDSRMRQVVYANGKLWGALDTAVTVGGQDRAGVAYYVVNPHSRKLVLQGQAGLASTDLTYPAVGVTDSGRGIMAFTLTGDNDYPSAAYAGWTRTSAWVTCHSRRPAPGHGTASPRTASSAAAGRVGVTTGRPRWSATASGRHPSTLPRPAPTPSTSWIPGPVRRHPRALGNWSTHISQLTP